MSRKMKFKRILLCALIVLIPILSINNKNIQIQAEDNNGNMCYNDKIEIDSISTIDSTLYNQFLKDSIKNLLVDEANTYIKKVSPRSHDSIPKHIVEAGLENYIDIMFIMAQTQLETNYGTLGAGRSSSRRSIFGVAIKRYNSYKHAIDDYICLLKKSYLRKGRTEYNLMNNYTTLSGARYAENRNYEKELKRMYNYIDKNTKIKELQEKYRLD